MTGRARYTKKKHGTNKTLQVKQLTVQFSHFTFSFFVRALLSLFFLVEYLVELVPDKVEGPRARPAQHERQRRCSWRRCDTGVKKGVDTTH